jgi:hypothetical protein
MKSFESLTYMEEYRRYWAKDEKADEPAAAEKKTAGKKK